MDAILQDAFMEIEKKSERGIQKLHIGEELRFMNRQDRLDSLELNDKAFVDNQITTKRFIKNQILVTNGHRSLNRDGDTSKHQLMKQTPLID